MEDSGWDKIVDAIDAKFGIADHGRTSEPLEDRPDLTNAIKFITFIKDGTAYKLERVTGPAITDRKTHYHKAAGGNVRFENIYDPDEVSHKTNLYIKRGDEWEPLDPTELSL